METNDSFCAICGEPIKKSFVNVHTECIQKTVKEIRDAGEEIEVEFEEES